MNQTGTKHRLAVTLAAIALVGLVALGAGMPRARGARPLLRAIEFNRDIRPILSENCFACHGPDSAARKADLRLDRREVAVELEAIVPNDPGASELVARIESDDPVQRMPPKSVNKTLTAAQKELLKRWIAAGAEYQPHWSLIAPKRPEPPRVKNEAWIRNPIDRFVLAELEKHGLAPAPEADRRTLARRLSLDLTGLPPEPAVVQAFVDDPAPDAYEQLVDRLMATPAVGRASGALLARRRALCRHPRHPLRQLPRELGLPRLGDQRLQPQPAVRRVHDRATGRRPPPRRHARPAGGLGLQPLQHHDQRGGHHRRGVPRPLHPRPHRDRVAGLARPDGRLCGLPRPQVRPAHSERVL